MVAALGITADAAAESPREAAESIGVAGLVSNSVARAATSSTRWYAAVVNATLWERRVRAG